MVDKLFLISITNSLQNFCLLYMNFRATISWKANLLKYNDLARCEMCTKCMEYIKKCMDNNLHAVGENLLRDTIKVVIA